MPRVAVVTPYFNEPLEKLERAHASVRGQTHADCHHFLVADGQPRDEIDGWDATHVRLPHVGDIGNTPRLVGCGVAAGLGFDFICLLDGDNWLAAEHVSSLLALAERTGAIVLSSPRYLHRPDTGEIFDICPESDGVHFADPNGMTFARAAFPLLRQWGFAPKATAVAHDRVIWRTVTQGGLRNARSSSPTVHYETRDAEHYLARGLPMPAMAKVNAWIDGETVRLPYAEYCRRYGEPRYVSRETPRSDRTDSSHPAGPATPPDDPGS